MYRSGRFVADHVEPTTDDQLQPNGVDLTLGAVFEQSGAGRIGRDGTTIGDRRTVRAETIDAGDGTEADGRDVYRLSPGGYVVRYGETVAIPADHVGFIYPRSSLLRNSCMLDTAVWDAGYEGKGEGLLEVHHGIELEAGARIAQLVLADADHEGTYDGSYQGENV
ncbi:deoxyuridine 5'-triphosphate nucleotidohydrolase [Natronomonas sp. F2-12]|jgi:deoxycytidine triphosphate deaminase|uniref:Deoxyuridine 5'-triphosphate nucleotidohydrolase n=1 Tax=Natronomonas aquatica TaxID=2841590 RepID=A0A9R1CQN9_9EURY|nr:deoxyuridine 5'-triphosphate nucleotidohydrolase [Natronomonas aquatica]MCQ4331986.1 deoxyuridine 5'-triphosphate nucleotidohydrolase [Natronomonas aquatica]